MIISETSPETIVFKVRKSLWLEFCYNLTYGRRLKKATGDDNIPVDLLKELGDNGLKIMTALEIGQRIFKMLQ